MVARWKPVHLGHAAVLEALLERAGEVLVGLGSANRYDARNPFTPEESAAMIRAVIGEPVHVRLVEVPDLGNPRRWRALVEERFGRLDLLVTANPGVRDLLRPAYAVAHPVWLVPEERRVAVDGTMVRRAMAAGEDWRRLVPPEVAALVDERGLLERFRREFGRATLALPGRDP